MVDPRLALVSEAKIRDSQALLEEYRLRHSAGEKMTVTDEELWRARRIVDSSIHPGSGQIIFPLARMSAFVPSNVPITLGMLTMHSTAATIFWQWVNQSYNALFNYANRSGAGEGSTNAILQAYGLATATSCGIALALKAAVQRTGVQVRPPWLIAYLAVVSAGSANILFTRQDEWRDSGIPVLDKEGHQVGVSKVAGQKAVAYTVLSRAVLLPLPIIALPGLLTAALLRVSPFCRRRPGLHLPIQVASIALAQGMAFPACVAAFPQTLKVASHSLEPEFHGVRSPNGQQNFHLYVNKGV